LHINKRKDNNLPKLDCFGAAFSPSPEQQIRQDKLTTLPCHLCGKRFTPPGFQRMVASSIKQNYSSVSWDSSGITINIDYFHTVNMFASDINSSKVSSAYLSSQELDMHNEISDNYDR